MFDNPLGAFALPSHLHCPVLAHANPVSPAVALKKQPVAPLLNLKPGALKTERRAQRRTLYLVRALIGVYYHLHYPFGLVVDLKRPRAYLSACRDHPRDRCVELLFRNELLPFIVRGVGAVGPAEQGLILDAL